MQRLFRQLALQIAAAVCVISISWPFYGIRNESLPWPETAIAIGCVALLLATVSKQQWWWQVIHSLFTPLAWSISLLSINANWFLFAFFLLLLVYRGAASEQIPLFLTNRKTVIAVSQLTSKYSNMRFVDLGAGVGSLIRRLALIRPDAIVEGVENAPGSWLIGRILTWRIANCSWLFKDFWKTSLGEYDVVYAFLSPAPMAELWEKVKREMRPGSLFISNSFPVPDAHPSEVLTVDDTTGTQLYCYQR